MHQPTQPRIQYKEPRSSEHSFMSYQWVLPALSSIIDRLYAAQWYTITRLYSVGMGGERSGGGEEGGRIKLIEKHSQHLSEYILLFSNTRCRPKARRFPAEE